MLEKQSIGGVSSLLLPQSIYIVLPWIENHYQPDDTPRMQYLSRSAIEPQNKNCRCYERIADCETHQMEKEYLISQIDKASSGSPYFHIHESSEGEECKMISLPRYSTKSSLLPSVW